VLLYEFKTDLDAYLRGCRRTRVHSMEEVIRFNLDNRERVLQFFGQERMEAAVEKGSLDSKKYRNALAKNRRLSREEGIDAVMKKHRLNAIVLPSGGPSWVIDMVNGDGGRNWDMDSTSYAAVAGYPHITVPAGSVFGPVGVLLWTGHRNQN
jgi:amidase